MEAIFELDRKLTEAGIPHVLSEMNNEIGLFGWQIVYPNHEDWRDNKPGCGDVVCNNFSYGHEEDLLEAMGFDINREEDGDDVVGWLTVEKAFSYFYRQWKKDTENGQESKTSL